MTGSREPEAIRVDAQQRVAELRNVARELWPDRDDAQVLSELLGVLGQLRQAEQALQTVEPQG